MFSSKTELRKRTPIDGTDRENFLSLLVDEYLNSNSLDSKNQVLANLANFAYDPVNYGFMRDVGVVDIFLYVLKNETDDKLLHFASAGICNLCNDPLNVEYIITHAGLNPIIELLKSTNIDILCDTIAILLYMYNNNTKDIINTVDIREAMQVMSNSQDQRLANHATIFLQDVCKDERN